MPAGGSTKDKPTTQLTNAQRNKIIGVTPEQSNEHIYSGIGKSAVGKPDQLFALHCRRQLVSFHLAQPLDRKRKPTILQTENWAGTVLVRVNVMRMILERLDFV